VGSARSTQSVHHVKRTYCGEHSSADLELIFSNRPCSYSPFWPAQGRSTDATSYEGPKERPENRGVGRRLYTLRHLARRSHYTEYVVHNPAWGPGAFVSRRASSTTLHLTRSGLAPHGCLPLGFRCETAFGGKHLNFRFARVLASSAVLKSSEQPAS